MQQNINTMKKQKAIELYHKFREANGVIAANGYAKKQAIICVDLFIEVFTNLEMITEIKYWQGVKEELKKI